MANRSYLYSCNVVPGKGKVDKTFIGISEWNYDIPLVFKLLVSGNPQLCDTSIWEMDEQIAIAGEYELGLNNLEQFLAKIEREDAQPLIAEALSFLKDANNKQDFFVLECGEIFDMEGENLSAQNKELFEALGNLDDEISESLASTQLPEKIGFIKSLFSNKTEEPHGEPLAPVYQLGLGNWSNVLYFDLSSD